MTSSARRPEFERAINTLEAQGVDPHERFLAEEFEIVDSRVRYFARSNGLSRDASSYATEIITVAVGHNNSLPSDEEVNRFLKTFKKLFNGWAES